MGLSRESGKVNFSRADPFGALRRTDILSHDNDNRRRPSPLAAGNNDDVAMTTAAVALMLRALDHADAESVSSVDPSTAEFRKLVAWLEDTKIRVYRVDQRAPLRDASDASAWREAFRAYLEALECPYDDPDHPDVLRWILSQAVSLQYRDRADALNAFVGEGAAKAAASEGAEATMRKKGRGHAFVDVNGAEIDAAIRGMATKLGLEAEGAYPLTLLRKVRGRLANHARGSGGNARGGNGEGGGGGASKSSVMADLPLGFTTGDAGVDEAAVVLRALYVQDLRALQSVFDETIVKVQVSSLLFSSFLFGTKGVGRGGMGGLGGSGRGRGMRSYPLARARGVY